MIPLAQLPAYIGTADATIQGFKRFDHAAVTISRIELAEDQKGSVQDRQVRESEIDHVGTVESSACRLTIWRRSMQQAQPTFGSDSSLHQSRDGPLTI
jgi:hypothetical protein